MPRKRQPKYEPDKVIERLREFIRFGYLTASGVARRMGVHNGTVYSWVLEEFRPSSPKRLTAFLDSMLPG